MKIDLEPADLQAIAEKVVELVKPLLSGKKDRQDDSVLDVEELCKYLRVGKKWVHERTHLKEIPYYKLSNKQLRFRKKEIDRWLDSLKTPAISEHRGKLRVV